MRWGNLSSPFCETRVGYCVAFGLAKELHGFGVQVYPIMDDLLLFFRGFQVDHII